MDINTWRYNREHSRSGAVGKTAKPSASSSGYIRFEDARLPARHNVKSLLPVTQVFAWLSCFICVIGVWPGVMCMPLS
jgi:hypothetical protein